MTSSLRPIPPSHWALPLSKDCVGPEYKMPYDEAAAALEALGFVPFWEVASVPVREVAVDDSDAVPHRHTLWAHPSGVLLQGNSYQWAHEDSVPYLSSLDMYVQVELLPGRTAYQQAMRYIKGSGGGEWASDGSYRELRHEHFGIGGESLVAWLRGAQQYGYLVPFEDWSIRGQKPLLLANFLLPLQAGTRPDLHGRNNGEIAEALQADILLAKEALRQRVPDTLKPFWAQVEQPPDPRSPEDARRRAAQDRIQDAMVALSDNLGGTGWRQVSKDDRAIMQRWLALAAGEHDLPRDQWHDRETLRGGNSLWLTLLMADQHPGNLDVLLRIIDEAPQDIIEQWCTVPDAKGYTMPLRILQRALLHRRYQGQDFMVPVDNDALELVMARLHARVGDDVLAQGLLSERRSVLGLLAEHPIAHSHQTRVEACARQHWQQLVQWLDERGLDWYSRVHWTSRRETTTGSKRAAQVRSLHQLAGTQARTAWSEALDPAMVQVDAQVMAMWDKHLLREVVPEPTTTVRSRHRL